MVRKEDVDYYNRFSRKELQSLCKRYNLPANRSSSEMAESLASYVQRNSMNSFGVAGNSAMSKTWDVKRDSYGSKLDKSREDCVQGAAAKEPGFILADNTRYHQERNGDGGLVDSASAYPYMRKMNEKGPIENSKKDGFRKTETRNEVVDSGDSPSSSSFEFHVSLEDVDYYNRFSRKELQSLCKRYNLPANRSSSEMAESLVSYVQRNSMNSVAFGVAGNFATTSRAPTSKTWGVKRDSYGNKLDKSREDCVQGAAAKEPGFILADKAPYHQERNGDGGLIHSASAPPYMRKMNEKDGFRKKDTRLDNRMNEEVNSGDSPSSSSFEFHVSLEEGINLSVDLNFNPSDWIKSMRDEVNVYDSSTRRRKSPPSGLGNSNGSECKKQKSSGKDKDKHVRRESSSSPVNKDNTRLPSDHHSNGEHSLASSRSRIKEGSENMSIPNSSGPDQIVSYCVESYSKSGCVNQVDLDCVNPPGKVRNGSVMVAAEHNHQTGDLLTETPENPSLQIQKVGNISTVNPLCPRRGGSELASSEAEGHHSNLPSSPRKISSYSESFKFRSNGGRNCLPPNTEEQEKSEVLSERARSD